METTFLAQCLKRGYIYLRPILDPDSGDVVWFATYEVSAGGEWRQERGVDTDPSVALTKCLRADDGLGILGVPLTFQPNVGWPDVLEEEIVPTVTPPSEWHLPTRMSLLRNTGAPLTALLADPRCAWCHRQREAKDLTLSGNLEFFCLTDQENCRQGATGRPQSEEASHAFVLKAVETNSNGSARAKTNGKAEGRLFVCSTEKGGCGKKKRTKSTQGRLPDLCSSCKSKKGAPA